MFETNKGALENITVPKSGARSGHPTIHISKNLTKSLFIFIFTSAIFNFVSILLIIRIVSLKWIASSI